MQSCQTCYSDLTALTLGAAYTTACCSSPICAGCIARNPRLKEYTPCLKCGDPRREMSGGASAARSDRLPSAAGHGRDMVAGGGEVVFEIGDDEPPEYDEVVSSSDTLTPGADVDVDVDADADAPTHVGSGTNPGPDLAQSVKDTTLGKTQQDDLDAPSTHDRKVTEENPPPEDERETVDVRHTVRRGDTLLAIARKYAADPHDLLTLNGLPPTALSSHPTILQTRRTLLISQRQIPRSSIRPAAVDHSDLPMPDADADRQREREREREIKRFQLVTKLLDGGVASTYLSLEEMKEADPLAYLGSGEDLPSKRERERHRETLTLKSKSNVELKRQDEVGAIDESGGAGSGGGRGKKTWPEESNREERALEAYWEDEEWERGAGAPGRERRGKWKVVSGAAVGTEGSATGGGEGSGGGLMSRLGWGLGRSGSKVRG